MTPATLQALEPSAEDRQLVELWLSLKTSPHTRRAYAADMRRFLEFVAVPLRALTLTDVVRFAESPEQGSLRPASLNRALTAVKSLLAFGHETGWLPFNVGAAVRLRPNREGLAQRILSEAEVARLLAAAPAGRDRVLLKLLYRSGVRVGEVCGLRWSDATPRPPHGGQITVFGKGGRTRTVLLPAPLWRELEQLRGQAAAESPMFPSRRGGGHLDPSQVRRIVYAAAARAGLEQRVSPHWMRHAHASHALDRGAPIHLVQATLGHASVATTGRYLHARPADSSGMYLADD